MCLRAHKKNTIKFFADYHFSFYNNLVSPCLSLSAFSCSFHLLISLRQKLSEGERETERQWKKVRKKTLQTLINSEIKMKLIRPNGKSSIRLIYFLETSNEHNCCAHLNKWRQITKFVCRFANKSGRFTNAPI